MMAPQLKVTMPERSARENEFVLVEASHPIRWRFTNPFMNWKVTALVSGLALMHPVGYFCFIGVTRKEVGLNCKKNLLTGRNGEI